VFLAFSTGFFSIENTGLIVSSEKGQLVFIGKKFWGQKIIFENFIAHAIL